jgi:hypothetical protein
MTAEDNIVTETVAEPVIDMAAHAAMLAEMAARIEAEKKIAAEQDAALQAVRGQCDAYRAAMLKDAI